MRNQIFLLIAAFLMSSSLYAMEFSELDENSDGKITKDEFYSHVSEAGLYSDWDLDNDGYLNESEFLEADYFDYGLYDCWDVDNDGLLDDDELYDGWYSNYDVNEDYYWDDDEWDDAGDDGFWDIF